MIHNISLMKQIMENSDIIPLPLVYPPNDIFKKKALPVKVVDEEIRSIINRMHKTMVVEKAIGIGANMVGILKSIAIVQLSELEAPLFLVNPEILWRSEEMQVFEEASLCFPGISAKISRSKVIEVSYLDYHGKTQHLKAEDFLATVIQHEVDYLNGKIFLDYLSKLKRDTLMKKMYKYMTLNVPHVHSSDCRH